MKLTIDSPELTAYVLRELPPERMAEVEAAIAADPKLLAEVESIGATSSWLTHQFAGEPALNLGVEARQTLLEPRSIGAKNRAEPSRMQSPKGFVSLWRWITNHPRWRIGLGMSLGVGIAVVGALVLTFAITPDRVFLSQGNRSAAPPRIIDSSPIPAPTEPSNPVAGQIAINESDPAPNPEPPSFEVPTASAIPTSGPEDRANASQPLLAQRYGLRQTGVATRKDPSAPPRPSTELPASKPYNRRGASASTELGTRDSLRAPVTQFRARTAADQPEQPRTRVSGVESYGVLIDNEFKEVTHSPLSTIGIDVDTAAYSNVRRYLREGQLPPADAVRIEELINYFTYDYTPPRPGEAPLRLHLETARCPWNPEHQLVRVALKARELERGKRPHANLVFLVDVSGSMAPENKLPLVKRSLRLLVDRLGEADSVGIVTYAGDARIALFPTGCDRKEKIHAAIDHMEAGSGTNGGEGIQGAYRMARDRFERAAVNRVILCTDGDFNIGITRQSELTELIQREAKSGIFLSVLGFGMGNLKDSTMELLADKGNGNYAYIDSFSEARKVLSEQLEGTLITVAKDVKIQLEFNPRHVARWRQIGYENRQLAARDFNDDRKDAGDAGAGQTITALYEIVPTYPALASAEGGLRYQPRSRVPVVAEGTAAEERELLLVKVRYKLPNDDASAVFEKALQTTSIEFSGASIDFQWASAVAGLGMLLRDSPHRGNTSFESILTWAQAGLGADAQGYRSEFIDLVRRAQSLHQR